MDIFACTVVFDIYATKLNFSQGTLRMWHGNYFGSSGGEIEFFDKNDRIIKGSELKEKIGLLNIKMQVFCGDTLLAEDNELTGWANAYNTNPFTNTPSFFQTLVGTFEFENETKARDFANDIKSSVGASGQGKNYFWNFNQEIDIIVDKNNVTIKWGYKYARSDE
jgi:hypothetical protein